MPRLSTVGVALLVISGILLLISIVLWAGWSVPLATLALFWFKVMGACAAIVLLAALGVVMMPLRKQPQL